MGRVLNSLKSMTTEIIHEIFFFFNFKFFRRGFSSTNSFTLSIITLDTISQLPILQSNRSISSHRGGASSSFMGKAWEVVFSFPAVGHLSHPLTFLPVSYTYVCSLLCTVLD